MRWTITQISRHLSLDQIRFLDFTRRGDTYEVRTSGGELVPPPARSRWLRLVTWLFPDPPAFPLLEPDGLCLCSRCQGKARRSFTLSCGCGRAVHATSEEAATAVWNRTASRHEP